MNGSKETSLCDRLREEIARLQLLHHRGLRGKRNHTKVSSRNTALINQRGYSLTLTASQVDLHINLTEVLEDLSKITSHQHQITNFL